MDIPDFDAYLMTAPGAGAVASLKSADLPPAPLLVRVAYSDLNYKDALAITGKGQILRGYPMTPGIDLVGTVLADESGAFAEGSNVLAIGHGIGENNWGGYSAYARIATEGVLPLPENLTAYRSMQLGTAGLTAALCVLAILDGRPPENATMLVTGASGGVGSVALLLLHRLGFRVLAATGRPDQQEGLLQLGADEVIDRRELEVEGRPLEKRRWFGVVETVGGRVLAGCLRHMTDGGVVASCGMAGGSDFGSSVFPFILRNVSLRGINSSYPAVPALQRAWDLLAVSIDFDVLDGFTQTIGLDQLRETSVAMIENKTHGRIVVRL